jgi:hypothetical protein
VRDHPEQLERRLLGSVGGLGERQSRHAASPRSWALAGPYRRG